jgi:uncharacterized membrane protein YgaE (UPF0421/DUF939 family)
MKRSTEILLDVLLAAAIGIILAYLLFTHL